MPDPHKPAPTLMPLSDEVDLTIPVGPRPEATPDPSGDGLKAIRALLDPSREGQVPRYLLGGSLGRGGMGEVLTAYDTRLRRTVALKTLRQEQPPEEVVIRFLREAQVTGQLEHPNIVPVYDIGIGRDGRVFFTMKRVQGVSLARLMQGKNHPSLVRRLQLFVAVCDAVAYAHDRGVVHRDLKPGNVMIGEYGEVLLLDWGLARRAGDEVEHPVTTGGPRGLSGELTRADVVLGTPSWMAPEQANGQPADTRSDQYSLGAILYLLLVEKPPFVPGPHVMSQVAAARFERPRAVAPAVPRELEAVCLRAMARAPEDRFASVKSLRDDVQAWLEGRPVAAFRYPLWLRASRFASRWKAQLAVGGAVGFTALVALAAVTAFGTALYVTRVRQEQDRAVAAERDAARKLADGLVTLSTIHADNGRAEKAREELDNATATYARLGDDPPLTAWFARAWIEHRSPRPLIAWTQPGIGGLVFASDDSRLVTFGADQTVRVLDTLTGATALSTRIPADEPLLAATGFLPDGRVAVGWFASSPARTLHFGTIDADGTLRESWTRPCPPRADGDRSVLSGDGTTLVLADAAGIHRLAVDDGSESGPALTESWLEAVSPDGGTITTRSRANGPFLRTATDFEVWDGRTGTRLWRLDEAAEGDFSPDGALLGLLVGTDIALVDARTGRAHWTIPAGELSPPVFRGGELLATTADGIVALDLGDGHTRWRAPFQFGGARPEEASFSPAGNWMISRSDGAAALVPLRGGSREAVADQGATAMGMDLSGDGLLVATVGFSDGAVRVFDRSSGRLLRRIQSNESGPPQAGSRGVAFSDDARTVAVADRDGKIRRWNLSSGELLSAWDPGLGIAMSVDVRGSTVAASFEQGPIVVWDEAGNERFRLREGISIGWRVAIRPDGGALAVSGRGERDPRWEVWDLATGERLSAATEEGPTYGLSWQSDGRRLVAPTHGDGTGLWTLDPVAREALPGSWSVELAAAFSPDDRLVAIGTDDGSVRLWDVAAAADLATLDLARPEGVADLRFTPDGRTLLAESTGGRIMAFDFDPALGIRRDAADTTPPSPEELLASARASAEWRAWDRAERLYRLYAEQSGKPAPARELAAVLVALGRPDEIAQLKDVLLADGVLPGTVDAWSAKP